MSDPTDDELLARDEALGVAFGESYAKWLEELRGIDPGSLEVLNHTSRLTNEWHRLIAEASGKEASQLESDRALRTVARYLVWEVRQTMHALEKSERDLADARDQLTKIGRTALWASISKQTD